MYAIELSTAIQNNVIRIYAEKIPITGDRTGIENIFELFSVKLARLIGELHVLGLKYVDTSRADKF